MTLPEPSEPTDAEAVVLRPAPTGSPAARRRATIGLLVAVLVAAVLTIAVATGGGALTGFDQGLTDFTRGWADSLGWPVDVAHVVGSVTAPFWSTVVGAVLVVLLAALRHRAAAAFLATSAILGVIVTEALKLAMGRQRPPGADQFESDRELEKSFPSGHSSAGIYLYLTTGLILLHLGRTRQSRWLVLLGRLLVLIGPTIGLSRLVLGVHWPSDVLAGWAVGSAAALTGALLLWDALDRGWARPGPRTTSQGDGEPADRPAAG